MKKILIKKMFRDLRINAVQFFAIFIMCFLAMLLFAAFDADNSGRLYSADRYYRKTAFADIFLTSEGFLAEDLQDIKRIEGVADAERRSTLKGRVVNHDNRKIELNFLESDNICRLYCEKGEPYTPGMSGIWIDRHFAEKQGIAIGETLTISCRDSEFSQIVRGFVDDSEHTNFVIDDTYLDTEYGQYCYAFLDASEYPFDNMTFDRMIVDAANVTDQVYLDDKDREELKKVKLSILDTIEKPSMSVLMKNEQPGYASQMSDCNFNSMMIMIFPPLFAMLAALSTVTTMSRLTAKQRTVIGTLKALGFSKQTVMFHYMAYSVFLSATGCAAGAIAGHFILGRWLFEDFTEYYSIPDQVLKMSYNVPLTAAVIVALAAAANYLSCRKLLVQNAAVILMPEAPKAAGAGSIEKLGIWNRLSFATRWNLRDININRSRSLMGIFGVVICSSILMGAFGMQESIGYQDTWLYSDLKPAAYTITMAPDYGYEWAYDIARQYNGQLVMQTDAQITGKDDSRLFGLTVVGEGNLLRFNDEKGNYITLPGYGAMISKKAADTLGVSTGDMITFRLPGEKNEYSVIVSKIHKTPDEQGIVMSRGCFESLHGDFVPGIIYTNMTPPDTLAADRKEVSGVNSRDKYVAALKRSNASTAELVNVIVVIGIIIGFVAIYNTGSLSFAEKVRDVATLKVLGFSTGRIRWILQQQNLFITGAGTLMGIGVGLLLIRILMASLDPTGDFMVNLSATPYLLAVLFSFAVSVAVNGIISTKVKSINMVEALQGVR